MIRVSRKHLAVPRKFSLIVLNSCRGYLSPGYSFLPLCTIHGHRATRVFDTWPICQKLSTISDTASTMDESSEGRVVERWREGRELRGPRNTPIATPGCISFMVRRYTVALGPKQTGNSSELAEIGVGSECPVYRRPFSGASTSSTRLLRPWAVVAT